MENKLTFGRSFRQMAGLIKDGRRQLLTALIMILIPVLLINLYSFYVMYDGAAVDFTPLDELAGKFNIFSLTSSTEQLEQLMEAMQKVLPQTTYRVHFYDQALVVLEFLIRVVADILVVAIGTGALDKKKTTDVLGLTVLRRIVPVLIIKLFADWFASLGNDLMLNALFNVAMMAHFKDLFGLWVMGISLVTAAALSLLVLCWGLLFVYYAVLSVCFGRCRLLVSLSYAREILRDRVFKNMLHIAPFVAVGFLVPSLLQFLAMLDMRQPLPGLLLIALAVILQMAASLFLWLFLLKDYFELESVSGIREKIRQMMEQAMRQREAMMYGKEERKKNDPSDEKPQEPTDGGEEAGSPEPSEHDEDKEQ